MEWEREGGFQVTTTCNKSTYETCGVGVGTYAQSVRIGSRYEIHLVGLHVLVILAVPMTSLPNLVQFTVVR